MPYYYARAFLLLMILGKGVVAHVPHPCSNPAVADENLSKSFRYGCFCGENYPNLHHPSGDSYRELNTTQRQALIAQYRAILPYRVQPHQDT